MNEHEWTNYGDAEYDMYGGCLVSEADKSGSIEVFQLYTPFDTGEGYLAVLRRINPHQITSRQIEDWVYATGTEQDASPHVNELVATLGESLFAKEMAEMGFGETVWTKHDLSVDELSELMLEIGAEQWMPSVTVNHEK